ncbi:MAG TPA: RidA family protein [Cytophagaceae bacterium]|jgi:enamine deaminase RidA (YjgF/YER057c/UK114 family)
MLKSIFLFFFLGTHLYLPAQQKAIKPKKITRIGDTKAPILTSISIPQNRALFMTSGLVAPILDSNAAVGSRQRFGDTKTQAIGTLKAIEKALQKEGLTMNDVIYLRAFLAPDKLKDNKCDYQAWFDAYASYFNNTQNLNKVARATVGVHSLVNPDWLIEVEAIAVYP